MEQAVFNPAQMRILHMMSFIKTPQQLDNLENAILQYFAQKADAGLDALCDSGNILLILLRNGAMNISQKTTPEIASNVVSVILSEINVESQSVS